MNCPKCKWPGLIGGHLKKRLAELEVNERIRREDNMYLRRKVDEVRSLLQATLLGTNPEYRALMIERALEELNA